LKDLKENFKGQNAGQVFHEFAVFCDKQLSNEEFSKDFDRVTKARERRRKEVDVYQELIQKSRNKQDKERHTREYKMSKKWYELDDEEYNRMAVVREKQVLQCLENYLRSLQAWDKFDSNVLRFFSIWLENAENAAANAKVASLLPNVPTHKFAILMNQLTSILQNDQSVFTKTLKQLICDICIDHPFHSLHHIYAGTHPSPADSDATTTSRRHAINMIASHLGSQPSSKNIWQRIYKADSMFHKLAMYKDKSKALSAGRQVSLDSLSPSATLKVKIKDLAVPPATMNIPLRPDKNYDNLPHIVDFHPTMMIASGISAPKILTAMTSDGKLYKQLVSTKISVV
jgi:serine-protein kinase ATM